MAAKTAQRANMNPTAWPKSRLGALLAELERHYGVPKSPRFAGPFEMILWEIVAYLADDARRELAFRALHDRVGLTPPRNPHAAPAKVLGEITRMGGSIAAGRPAPRVCAPPPEWSWKTSTAISPPSWDLLLRKKQRSV